MSKRVLILLIALVVVGAGVGVAAFMGVFNSDPDEVSLPAATTDPSSTEDIEFDGTWAVDQEFGTFEEEFTSTYAGYRISEEFAGVGTNVAVGRTPNVEGTMTIDGNEITDVSLTVDTTTLKSDRDMRDNALRTRGLQTDQFPEATFELSEPISIPDEPAEGEKITADAVGELTLHGVTKEVTLPLEASWADGRITVVSSFPVLLADHQIERPTTQRVVSIEEEGTVEMQLIFTKDA